MMVHKSHPDTLIYWREALNDDAGATEEAICDNCGETVAKLVNDVIKPTSIGKRVCD